MKPLYKWLHIDEASLSEATMLILNIEPHRVTDDEDNFDSEKYDQIYQALKADIRSGKLKNNNPASAKYPNEFNPFIPLDDLKAWVDSNNIYAPFFDNFGKHKPIIKNDLIDLVSLSKVIALHYGMTIPEACHWIANEYSSKIPVYGICKGLPEVFEDPDDAGDTVSEILNLRWWNNPEKLEQAIEDCGLSIDKIAFLKSNASILFGISLEKLDELSKKSQAVILIQDKSKPITKKDLINLVLLSKIIAFHYEMTVPEACHWIATEINKHETLIYTIQGETLPEPFESFEKAGDIVMEVVNQSWWDNHGQLENVPGYSFYIDEVAVLILDASKLFEISAAEIYELTQVISQREKITPDNNVEENRTPYYEELHKDYISDDLKLLFRAAFEFWSTADPEDRTTHPSNGEVTGWLKQQGMSQNSSEQGPVIIKPKWGAKGRRRKIPPAI